MHAEREKLKFADFSLGQNGGQNFVLSAVTHQQFNISPLQAQYLEHLRQGQTIEEMVLEFLAKGLLVRFGELHGLMELLLQHGLILNPHWQELLTAQSPAAAFASSQPVVEKNKVTASDLNRFPFFHGMRPPLLEIFADQAECYSCPANTRLCVQGQNTRDLYALSAGQAAVYRNGDGNSRTLIARLPVLSVFGEGGFLLGRPRSADVVTTKDSRVVRIRHHPRIDELIRGDQASQMYRCLWILHAFANSTLFQKMPLEAWNDAATLGSLQKYPPDHLLFNEGSPGASFFVVVQGQVSAWQKGKRINTLVQGHCFGEISIFASRGVRTASVKTDKDSLLVEISPQQFYPLLARHLLLAKELEQLAYQRLNHDQTRLAE